MTTIINKINKVVYGQTTLLDLTGDTVTAAHIDSGYTAHDASGATIIGISTKDADTSDATALAADILSGQTAYANGTKLTGTMVNRGAVNGTISAKAEIYTVAEGYHNGSGSVSIDSAEQAKLVPENIRSGISILGVSGAINTAALEPITLRCGWVGTGNGIWTYESPTDSLADMYEVTAGHEYWLTLGATVGTRFRAMFTTIDVSTVTSGTVQGTALNTKNTSDPPPFQNLWYTPSEDGYIVVQKDNVGNTNVKTYLYDKTASWL
ncbi:MAG: hypothetical protein IJ587_07230 [Synergistaceae bacterium]|nr:hypothetical protein [Synergistaceae bacterium]